MSRDLLDRMLMGSLFHSCGAMTLKLRSPYLLSFDFGSERRRVSLDERRVLVGTYGTSSSYRYLGPIRFRALYTFTRSL